MTRKELPKKELTLAGHAEAWWKEQGKKVPKRKTKAWQTMYIAWHTFAFADFLNSMQRGENASHSCKHKGFQRL